MKKITKFFGVFALALMLGVTQPAFAQTPVDGSPTTQTVDDYGDDDDNGKWGLAGLLGLLGLLGLRKKDNHEIHRTTTTNR